MNGKRDWIVYLLGVLLALGAYLTRETVADVRRNDTAIRNLQVQAARTDAHYQEILTRLERIEASLKDP